MSRTSAVVTAAHRAKISALLSNEPGREFKTSEVAAHLGVSPYVAGQLLRGMANGKLITQSGVPSNKKWSWPIGNDTPPADDTPPPAKLRTAPPPTPAKEIELEAFGITIIVGRNERTGRLRITLEG